MARFQTLSLVLANLLIPAAILVFATGFFPYKPFMPGLAVYEKLGWEEKMGWTKEPEPQFDRVVFMVVDALRSDFVFSSESGMSFVQGLIRSGAAIPFTAHATSPTITMPRVKAITTGSIPSFLDVILNFAESDTSSTLAAQDTWLAQLKAKQGGKLVMYGDDTWLKLFPGFFERADGTSSFFVSDFTEVDNNVTRHVPDELLNSDWNAMIMHYLGLDHIGHKTGPKGPNMIPKQIEMDGIVRDIYEAIENEDHLANTLFVMCGDHGMNEGGNHGGSAPGETSPALVFMSPKIKKITEFLVRESPIEQTSDFEYYKKIEQSDIAPTLAGLMGFPVPRNNLGVFIPEFLHFWDEGTDRARLLLHNAQQMKKIIEANFPAYSFADEVQEMDCEGSLSSGKELACKWQKAVQVMSTMATIHPQLRVQYLYDFCRTAQEIMSSTASNYDVPRLVFGTALAFLSVVLSVLAIRPDIRNPSFSGLFYTLTLILYTVLMFASSYVEEEHQFWYWLTSAYFFALFLSSVQKQWLPWPILHPAVMLLVVFRIARRWNQTGQKYAGAPDIVHSGVLEWGNNIVLWSLVGAAYMDNTIRLSRHVARSIANYWNADAEDGESERFMGTMAVLPSGVTAFIFKLAFTARDAPELVRWPNPDMMHWLESVDLVLFARMVFGGLGLSAAWLIYAEWRKSRSPKHVKGSGALALSLFDTLTLILLTQTRTSSLPLYLLFRLTTFFLTHLSTYSPSTSLSPTTITTTTLLLTHTSFFLLGNTNSISSIDLSNSYNGVAGYNISLVGLLLFVSNWAGPIYWSLAGLILLGAHGSRAHNIDVSEMDARDWIAEERAHLVRLADAEKEKGERRTGWGAWRRHVALLTLGQAAAAVAVMGACTVLRTHLFIWTVFSPKFLYAMAWGTGFHLGVTVGVGGGFWWVGGW
ncbi:GPI ethanolamine phosphate transferas-like protein 2 [Polyplosphaeria fusca]|uniref:GPI ethanolamine phosphate transferase 2 n=1 Tax=Polyplosphaeria fusca TaxID=682080 RepID=A0A9P4QRB8_9PLEO|nr:GPI ethanolamine phosphate transferas-like protein 2 [Polyplosphaeria fusca]